MINPSTLLFIMLVILSILSPVSEKIRLVPGIFLMWLYVSAATRMTNSACIKFGRLPPVKEQASMFPILIISAVLFLHADLIVRYYTGQGLNDVIQNLSAGISNYNLYQSHFREEEISKFKPIKVYLSIWLAIIKVIAFYAIYTTIIAKSKPLFFLIMALPFILYSIGRGTSIEIFEIILFILSGLYVYFINLSRSKKLKITAYSIILAFFALYVFDYNISARFNFDDISINCAGPFCFESDRNPNATEVLLMILSSYLIGGLVNINNFILHNGFSLLLPFNSTGLSVGMYDICISGETACGSWMPMLISYLSYFGFIILLPALYFTIKLFLWYSRRIESQFDYIMAFFIFNYLTFSLFIGEGLFASSANLIILIFMALKVNGLYKKRYWRFTL